MKISNVCQTYCFTKLFTEKLLSVTVISLQEETKGQ